MPIQISCPSCAKQLRVPEDLLGKSVRCPNCQNTFTAEEPGTPSPPPSSEAAGVQSTAPESPRRRDRDVERDDDDDYPRRSRALL